MKHPPHRTGCSDPIAFLPSPYLALALSCLSPPICWICSLELAVPLLKIHSVLLVAHPASPPGSLGIPSQWLSLYKYIYIYFSFLYIVWKLDVCWLLISQPWHLSLLLHFSEEVLPNSSAAATATGSEELQRNSEQPVLYQRFCQRRRQCAEPRAPDSALRCPTSAALICGHQPHTHFCGQAIAWAGTQSKGETWL